MRKNALNKQKPAENKSVKQTEKPLKKRSSFWATDRSDDGTTGNYVSVKGDTDNRRNIAVNNNENSKNYYERRITNFNPNGTPRKKENAEQKDLVKTAISKASNPDAENKAEKEAKRKYEPRKFTRRPLKATEEEIKKKPRNPGIKKTNEHTRRRSSDLVKPTSKKFDKSLVKKSGIVKKTHRK